MDLHKELEIAIKNNNINKVNDLLIQLNKSILDHDGFSLCVEYERIEILKLLLKKSKCSPNANTNAAIRSCHNKPTIFYNILNNDVRTNSSAFGNDLFIHSVKSENIDLIRLLLNDIDITDELSLAIFWTLKNENKEILELLLKDQRINENTFFNNDFNILSYIVKLNNKSYFKKVIFYKHSFEDYAEALFISIQNNNLYFIKEILNNPHYSFELNTSKYFNFYHLAAKIGNVEILQILIDNKVRLERAAYPIDYSSRNNNIEMTKFILKNKKLNVNHIFSSTLIDVIKHNHLDVLELLINHKILNKEEINKTDFVNMLNISLTNNFNNILTLLYNNSEQLTDTQYICMDDYRNHLLINKIKDF